MREIKFRAWDINKKEMFKPSWLNLYTTQVVVFDYVGRELPSRRHCILMQYTGLKDKNGKEIYEGDILNSGTPCASNCLCKFKEGFFGFEKQSYPEEGLYAFRSENKIIGNIYENPELWGYIADSEQLSENDKHGVDVNIDKVMG